MVVNLQGQLVNSAAPSHAGDALVLFATGLGPVSNQQASGVPASLDTLVSTAAMPQVSIGGATAKVLFSGLTPGFVGLYQVNIEVPEGATTGDAVPVALSIGDKPSNTVTISVR